MHLVRNPCFSAVACHHFGKTLTSLFWLCTLKDSSSQVRHWSSPYLVLLPRLYPCSQWYCPMALKPSSRRTWEDPFHCSWNPLEKERQCLVLLAVFWQLNSLCYWPTFCLQLFYIAILAFASAWPFLDVLHKLKHLQRSIWKMSVHISDGGGTD